MNCQNRCEYYKIPKTLPHADKGLCRECGIFVLWVGFFCPCCGTKLRKKRVTRVCRARQHKMMGVKREK